MISPPIARAMWKPTSVLPVAVGPTIATIGSRLGKAVDRIEPGGSIAQSVLLCKRLPGAGRLPAQGTDGSCPRARTCQDRRVIEPKDRRGKGRRPAIADVPFALLRSSASIH